jgi:chorismate synthase
MAGNIFGNIFKVTTFGESHGPAVGCIIDGVPAGLELTESDIQKDLDRRRPGQSSITTPRQEADLVEILSGVFEGQTTGTPLALVVRNKDQRSEDYSATKNVFRPGHADHSYFQKYGIFDHRGGGRSSGRETTARVAAGAVAKKILDRHKINITAYTLSVGAISAKTIDLSAIEKNLVRAPDFTAAEAMVMAINTAKDHGDSLGGIVEAIIKGCPAGLGDPVFDKLEARLAAAIMSIGAVKGVEFGSGFKAALMPGSEHNDQPIVEGGQVRTKHNFSGGITGGISTGEDIVFRLAVKPPSSIAKKQLAVTRELGTAPLEIQGRHDPCLCPRMVPVVEAMAALVIVDALLLQKTVRL